MKITSCSRIAVVWLSLLLAVSALAAEDVHKESFKLGSAILVSNRQLSAGEYQVKWEGVGPVVDISILRDGKVLATLPAEVINLIEKSNSDITELRTAPDGSKTLSEIHFANKNYAL